jgi:tetratricopeptide (TPR) repeat protein
MDYKKILTAMVIAVGMMNCSIASSQASDSSEPVLLNPSRVQGEAATSAPKSSAQNAASGKGSTKTISTKIQYTRYKKVKKAAPKKVNYNQIDKMIENSYFDRADNLLQSAINSNSRDIKARALRVVSLAKQLKLDPAQEELNELLKTCPNNADLHYAQGIVHYKRTTSSNMVYINNSQKLFEDALNEFKKAIALDSTDARYYNAAGVAALNLDNYDEAKTYFKKAVQLDNKYSTAIDNLGTIDFAEGKLAEAEKKFKQALQYNTQNTTAMYHLAQLATQKQEYAKALTYLNNALAINENSATTYNLMGEVYEYQGNEPAAINAYRKSIMVKPEFPMPYFNLAGVYQNRGDGEFAIEQLKTVLSVNPNFNDAKLKIADISLANGKYNQAIENYSALVNVKEYHADALKGLASAYFEKAQVSSNKAQLGSNGELFKAFDYINKAIVANPDDLELHLAKLKLAKITNQPALSDAELKAITMDTSGDLVNMVVKGEAYLTLYDYNEAKKAFDAAANSAKTLDDQMYLAEIFLYHKQFDSAKTVLQNILKTTAVGDSQNQQAVSDLDYIQKNEKLSSDSFKSAQYYLKKKNVNAAVEYLSRSLSLNPNNADAHFILAKLFEQQKNYAGAAANYKAYLGLTVNPLNKKKIEKKISHLYDKR